MADVFISYKRENRAAAALFAGALAKEGFSVWWDEQITPREAWDSVIEGQISVASSVLVLWSPLSVGSDWVRTEAHYGQRERKLVPVKIEPCEPPMAFFLTQTLDLSGWDGAPAHLQWRKLLTWLADRRIPQQDVPAPGAAANPFRDTIGQLASGEPIVDGAFINEATPAGTLFRDAVGTPVMRVLPRGQFVMGGAPGDPDRTSTELPQKGVHIAYPLAIGTYPVTGAEFSRHGARPEATNARPPARGWFKSKPPPASAPLQHGALDCAANCVSWLDARAYVAALSAATSLAYRLPSESEWEYACRARAAGRYSWGDSISEAHACFGRPAPSGPIPPGRFPPNAFGLYDMHGNVREWTGDLWHESHDHLPPDGRPAIDGHGSMRVIRGGGWSDPPSMLRASARGRATETLRSEVIGFRVVRELAKGNAR
ncbi:SUMF1/EgtB/PvdO family nonheme iron enzyme [Sphingomonas sp. AR_OL41]|uniref:SUMF1/EgtB/PvdO family nonheme iron enzyme n=1 Tax=Sphingomonas sp. AR_OL41 TaxID=3042729 RepID=UPI00247FBDF2|nr:SUMF1/EgtB/PvdO family nonheme iron enzyme [Sphingomonas sp. AR_OL41]MDH7971461.1 SUMF1/EgtB/PvdO family nonheme iron enzyme [Sphingomonas sp. AR_OL41]